MEAAKITGLQHSILIYKQEHKQRDLSLVAEKTLILPFPWVSISYGLYWLSTNLAFE